MGFGKKSKITISSRAKNSPDRSYKSYPKTDWNEWNKEMGFGKKSKITKKNLSKTKKVMKKKIVKNVNYNLPGKIFTSGRCNVGNTWAFNLEVNIENKQILFQSFSEELKSVYIPIGSIDSSGIIHAKTIRFLDIIKPKINKWGRIGFGNTLLTLSFNPNNNQTIWHSQTIRTSDKKILKAFRKLYKTEYINTKDSYGCQNLQVLKQGSPNSLTTSNKSGSSNYENSYSYRGNNSQPQLFYDPATNGMRECAYDGLSNGKCLSFKASLKTYNANTLFYNKNSGAMQPCLGSVNTLGQCSAFGLFNSSTVSKGQLFYDPKYKKMSTCSFVTVMGKCSHYDLTPNSWAKDTGGYRMTDPKNSYNKRSPRTPQQSIDVGMRMLSGGCTLGIDC